MKGSHSALVCLVLLCIVGLSWQDTSAQPKVTSKEIGFAPEAELINGIDDVDPQGNCLAEIKSSCNDTTPGEGALADCLSDLIAESETGSETGASVSEACREEVYQFKIQRNTNINANVPLARACRVDAERSCNVTWFFGYKSGQVIACLRDMKDKLAPACQKEVLKTQLDAATDYRADAQLHEACKDDADNLCKDVAPGGGRVQACLRDKRMQLSWACEEQLFRQETENADDIRLSVRLFSKCIAEKRRFCSDIEPGSSKVKDCLEENRNEKGFGEDCKDEIDKMIERRVRDFRLDSRLRTTCEADIYTLCAFFGDPDSMDTDDSSVIRCLQDYVQEIQVDACKDQVVKYQILAAQDIRFDVPLADACYDDRQKLCGNVPPGSARVIRCLSSKREQLSINCRAVLFDEEIRFSENIDFQFPMKQACQEELKMFCKDIPHGGARAIRCLQDNKYKKEFGTECREQVNAYDQKAASDYRLNYRLNSACKADISDLCSDECRPDETQTCSGRVLRCLTEKRDDIKSEACQKEVFYFEKMEVQDYRNDVILAAACREDVDMYCSHVEPGEGRVHDCLRSQRSKLSETCRKEELLLEQAEAENVELRPGILKACRDERHMFCNDVQPGSARVFRCLAEKMGDMDFGETCRKEIINKLQRRQANWKLDPSLRKACKPYVDKFCSAENMQNGEQGSVYKCLIHNYEDIEGGCQKELGRAVHMAFFVWQPKAILTSDCDDDIQKLCLAKRPNMIKTPGAVGTCLATILETSNGVTPVDGANFTGTLSEKCRIIADVAEPPNMKQAFEASLAVAMLQSQLSVMEGVTGMTMVSRNDQGVAQAITLTGWTALAGITALIMLCMIGAVYAYRRYKGLPEQQGYTLVVKKPGKGKGLLG